MSNRGTGIMLNNYEFLTPKEQKELEYKKFFEAQTKYQKEQEKKDKEVEKFKKLVKKATKERVKKEIKGSQDMKEKMAKVRAGKGLKKC
jgi:hypothetical protein